ncbi:DUF6174 domain-containing protein [Streptomyces sp. SBT349]|uniref:DUF6174 domain-containing protein n=1 Tax=Streptomyces sp. SBT349 TaxID=1580539 RepID=UPI00066CE3F5|nr:DUF6174 domain-containing protein [Streptomyces sp. SBT349]
MYTMMRLGPPAAAAALLLSLAGCGSEDAAEAAEPSWREPDGYRYTLESSCGERSLLGRFAIEVAGGRVVDATAEDETAGLFLGHGDDARLPPTIGELLDEAEAAREDGADVVTVTYPEEGNADGEPPSEISIDYREEALDDEACYEISGYTAAG